MREAECGTDASTVPRIRQSSSAYGRSAGLRDVGDQNRRVVSRGMPTQVPPEAASLGIDVMPSLDCKGISVRNYFSLVLGIAFILLIQKY